MMESPARSAEMPSSRPAILSPAERRVRQTLPEVAKPSPGRGAAAAAMMGLLGGDPSTFYASPIRGAGEAAAAAAYGTAAEECVAAAAAAQEDLSPGAVPGFWPDGEGQPHQPVRKKLAKAKKPAKAKGSNGEEKAYSRKDKSLGTLCEK